MNRSFIQQVKIAGPGEGYTQQVRIANADEIGNITLVATLPEPNPKWAGMLLGLQDPGKNRATLYLLNSSSTSWVLAMDPSDPRYKGYYTTATALLAAHPTANAGDFATVGETDTIWAWDVETTRWVNTATAGSVTAFNSRTGAVLPTLGDYEASQIGNDSRIAGTTVKAALETLDADKALPAGVMGYPKFFCTHEVGNDAGALDAISVANINQGDIALVIRSDGARMRYQAVTSRVANPLFQGKADLGGDTHNPWMAIKPADALGMSASVRWELMESIGPYSYNIRTEQFGMNDDRSLHGWTSSDNSGYNRCTINGHSTGYTVASLWNVNYGLLYLLASTLRLQSESTQPDALASVAMRRKTPVTQSFEASAGFLYPLTIPLELHTSTVGNFRPATKAGSIVGISVKMYYGVSTGSLIFEVTKNGVGTGCLVTLFPGSPSPSAVATFAPGTYAFSAGDLLGITATKGTGYTPTDPDASADAFLEWVYDS